MEASAPRALVVTVGDELLLGETVDTNAAWLGRKLAALGVPVFRKLVVADEEPEIRRAVGAGLDEADLVLTTGGLGPTEDDRTLGAVSDLLARPLHTDPDLLRALKERFRLGGHPAPAEALVSQAQLPEEAVALDNPRGTAPGILLHVGDRILVLLPGVPGEMKSIFQGQLLDHLRSHFGSRLRPVSQRMMYTTGIPEAVLARRLAGELERSAGDWKIAFLPGLRGVALRLSTTGSEASSERMLDELEGRLASIIGGHLYSAREGDLIEAVGPALIDSGRTVAVAESCTGGLVGKRLTDWPGVSASFKGGVIAYANEAKLHHLGVPRDLLEREGAVSEGVALAMAEGVAERFASDIGLAVTGVAGPSGGTPDKPVGTVWYAVWHQGGAEARRGGFPGERDMVRERSAQAALALLLDTLAR